MKFAMDEIDLNEHCVAPLAGAWIEMIKSMT